MPGYYHQFDEDDFNFQPETITIMPTKREYQQFINSFKAEIDWLQQHNQSALSRRYDIDLEAPLRLSKITLEMIKCVVTKRTLYKELLSIFGNVADKCQLIHKTFFLTIYHNILTRIQTQLSPARDITFEFKFTLKLVCCII